MTRTQQEILDRIEAAEEDDVLGFRREVLICALDAEHARPFLKEGADTADWAAEIPEVEARSYLAFAIVKITDHRGLSASRSVEKLTEFAWLMGRDDVVAAMEYAEYPMYGAPKIKAFADGMGWDAAWTEARSVTLDRMATGQACSDYCKSGCES